MHQSDILQRFIFARTDVRGGWVSLDASFQMLLRRHSYPAAVRVPLGEVLAGAALLSATIKFNGTLTLQLQGDGPVHLLLAQCSSQRTLRGLARWHDDPARWAERSGLGAGRLAITVDMGLGGERYQGVVAVEGGQLAAALEGYFRHSEQLPTRLWLAADGTRAVGLLLQRLPGGGGDADAWERSVQLARTITHAELLAHPGTEVLRRLFHQEELRVFEPEPISFRCGCTRERVAQVLTSLGREELGTLLREQDQVGVDCEFCNHHYAFDAVDIEQLFAEAPATVSSQRH